MPLAPAVIAAIIGAGASGADAVARGGPKRQFKYNKKLAEVQNSMNRSNLEYTLGYERELQREAREYDSPQKQMERYLAAGLNPHLIYGTGSSAGQAFPIHAPQVPGVNLGSVDASYPQVGGSFIGAMQSLAQTGLSQARTSNVETDTVLKSMMVDIAKTNPMLNPSVAANVAEQMEATALLKAREAQYLKSAWVDTDKNTSQRIYVAKIHAELESMLQRLGLNTMDLQIKNKILESKEFENAVKQIQAQWLKDGDVTPEHIRQGLMLLLSKMTGK